jgi:hypothetical protein
MKSFKIKRLIYVVYVKIVMDKKPLFVLYSVVAITIALSFSSIDAQTTMNTPGGNITNATKSMGESIANQSTAVVDNATKSMGASMANNASAVVGNISESVVTRTANAASSETESIVNQTANTAGNKTQDFSTNSTT